MDIFTIKLTNTETNNHNPLLCNLLTDQTGIGLLFRLIQPINMLNKVIFSSILALLLSSIIYSGCTTTPDSEHTDTEVLDEAVSASPQYTREQIVFSLSWLVNINAKMKSSRKNLVQHANKLHDILKNQTIIDSIGKWEIIWGPYIYSKKCKPGSTSDSCVTDNTMMLVKRQGEFDAPEYVLAIAGTNPSSTFGWLSEDFKVNKMVTWPETSTTKGQMKPFIKELKSILNRHKYCKEGKKCVSLGTARGLTILLDSVGHSKNPAENNPLIDFLTNNKTIESGEIAVAGHSLGGALSPSMALALKDNMPTWAGEKTMTISTYPTAGASPGEANFRAYLREQFAGKFFGKMNALDIVPHAWQDDMLAEIPSLYKGNQGLDTVCVIKGLAKYAGNKAKGRNYRSLYNQDEAEVFKNAYVPTPDDTIKLYCTKTKLRKKLNDLAYIYKCGNRETPCPDSTSNFAQTMRFLIQAGYQHTTEYVKHYGITAVGNILQENIDKTQEQHKKHKYEAEVSDLLRVVNNPEGEEE